MSLHSAFEIQFGTLVRELSDWQIEQLMAAIVERNKQQFAVAVQNEWDRRVVLEDAAKSGEKEQ